MTSFRLIFAPFWRWGFDLELLGKWGLLRKLLSPPRTQSAIGWRGSPTWGTSSSSGGSPGTALDLYLPLLKADTATKNTVSVPTIVLIKNVILLMG